MLPYQVMSSERGTRAAWRALAVVLGSSIMVALDSTILNVALHEIGLDLGADDSIQWIVTSYLLGVCAAQPATGWLADRFGQRTMFLRGVVVFAVASAACAVAPTMPVLVLARLVQGLGGGVIIPVGMAMVLGIFPKEQHGRATSIWGVAAMLTPSIGPAVGGWLVDVVSWRWLFVVNLPIGLATLLTGFRHLPDGGHRERRRFDGAGLLLGCGGLTLVVLTLAEATTWGWVSLATLAGGGGGVLALATFVRHELRVTPPLIQLRMFLDRPFRLAMGVMFVTYIAQFGRLVFVPLELAELRGATPLTIGLLFFPAAIVTAAGMSLGGRLVDRIGPRRPSLVGTTCTLVSAIGFATLQLSTPLALIAALMCLQGFGLGIVTSPTLVAGLSELPAALTAQGASLRALVVQVSGAFAVAALGTIVASVAGAEPTDGQLQLAYNLAFAAVALAAVVAVVLASRLPNPPLAKEGVATVGSELKFSTE